MSQKKNSILEICAEKGLKMTRQRKIICNVISGSDDHPDVEEIYLRAREEDKNISIATVYRTMRLLEESQVLDRLDFRDGRARYEESSAMHHDHLIDLETGEVHEFLNDEIEKLQITIAKEMGYELLDHRLELYGRKIKN